jgi:hypothetical protein
VVQVAVADAHAKPRDQGRQRHGHRRRLGWPEEEKGGLHLRRLPEDQDATAGLGEGLEAVDLCLGVATFGAEGDERVGVTEARVERRSAAGAGPALALAGEEPDLGAAGGERAHDRGQLLAIHRGAVARVDHHDLPRRVGRHLDLAGLGRLGRDEAVPRVGVHAHGLDRRRARGRPAREGDAAPEHDEQEHGEDADPTGDLVRIH